MVYGLFISPKADLPVGLITVFDAILTGRQSGQKLQCLHNLVPRSLVDEAEGEIWPNAICTTGPPVRNVTGKGSAHAQQKISKMEEQ